MQPTTKITYLRLDATALPPPPLHTACSVVAARCRFRSVIHLRHAREIVLAEARRSSRRGLERRMTFTMRNHACWGGRGG